MHNHRATSDRSVSAKFIFRHLFNDNDCGAAACSLDRRGEPGQPGPDHDHVVAAHSLRLRQKGTLGSVDCREGQNRHTDPETAQHGPSIGQRALDRTLRSIQQNNIPYCFVDYGADRSRSQASVDSVSGANPGHTSHTRAAAKVA